MVTGDPLTPGNVQLKRQTRTGSPTGRYIPPRDVDGATMFVARNGRELREFLFADVEQAYQANDLAVLARHILTGGIDQDYDAANRLFHVVLADGALATVTIYRAEQVTAWSVQHTDGAFRAVSTVDDEVFVLVERQGVIGIERFDATLATDAALTGASGTPEDTWTGLGHLEGRGKHAGRLGALRVRSEDGVEFQLGTGFSDAQRDTPPPAGSWVTFSYRGLTAGGVPRFASFVRVREF